MVERKIKATAAQLFDHDSRSVATQFRLLNRPTLWQTIEPVIQGMTTHDAAKLNAFLQDGYAQAQAAVYNVANIETWGLQKKSQGELKPLADALRLWSAQPEDGLPWHFTEDAKALCGRSAGVPPVFILPMSSSGMFRRIAHIVEGLWLMEDIAKIAKDAPSNRRFTSASSVKRGTKVTSDIFAPEINGEDISSLGQQAECLRSMLYGVDGVLTEVAERGGGSCPLGVLDLPSHIIKLKVYAPKRERPLPQPQSQPTPKAALA